MTYGNYGILTRRRNRYLPLFSFLSGVVLVAIIVQVGCVIWNLKRNSDMGAIPPEESFRRVFLIPPPAEVQDLKAAGYVNLSGGTVVLRFPVDNVETVVKVLKENPRNPLIGPYMGEKAVLPASDDFIKEFERAVVWEGVHHIKRPEYYGFGEPFKGWSGTVVVDRQRRLMFVRADLY